MNEAPTLFNVDPIEMGYTDVVSFYMTAATVIYADLLAQDRQDSDAVQEDVSSEYSRWLDSTSPEKLLEMICDKYSLQIPDRRLRGVILEALARMHAEHVGGHGYSNIYSNRETLALGHPDVSGVYDYDGRVTQPFLSRFGHEGADGGVSTRNTLRKLLLKELAELFICDWGDDDPRVFEGAMIILERLVAGAFSGGATEILTDTKYYEDLAELAQEVLTYGALVETGSEPKGGTNE